MGPATRKIDRKHRRYFAFGPTIAILGVLAGLIAVGCGSGDDQEVSGASTTTTTPAPSTFPRALATAPTTEPTPAPAADPPPAAAILVGAGDIASCTQENDDETAALIDAVVASEPNAIVFTAGDNVYEDGTADEFTRCYGPAWGRHKDRTRPAAGNHDYHSGGARGYFSYFGTSAGDPARGYYSYDLGAWHIIVLNSGDECNAIACGPGSAQNEWLRQDLASNQRLCTLAIWHHPLFSSGRVHGSDRTVEPLWDALYEHGADLVLNGHEHNYERFAPQTPSGAADPAFGIRQIIVGTGGESHYFQGERLQNSEVADGETYGVLKLTLRAADYDWEFIPVREGQFRDSGTGQCHGAPAG